MDLQLSFELLTGRYTATEYNNRNSAEWPPHPARIFSALTAAWAEGDEAEDERKALEWLETLPPPAIEAATEVSKRKVVSHYVPVNDVTVLSLPEKLRDKMERAEEDVERLRLELSQLESEQGSPLGVVTTAKSKDRDKLLKQIHKAEEKAEKERKSLQQKMGAIINDIPSQPAKDLLKSAYQLIPAKRLRQARTFPSVIPSSPFVTLIWPNVDIGEHLPALQRLVGRVTRIGHSSSLVAARFIPEERTPTYIPDEEGTIVLRVPTRGQLSRLIKAHQYHRGIESRVLPCSFQTYRENCLYYKEEPIKEGVFSNDEWIVFKKVGGVPFTMCSGVVLASTFRRALMKHADQPVPEVLSGHVEDGASSTRAHAAYVPLPYVGSPHADGRILGIALVLPRSISREERKAVLRAVARFEEFMESNSDRARSDSPPELKLTLGRDGTFDMQRIEESEEALFNLTSEAWSKPSKSWLTATPIALDRHPGDLNDKNPIRRAESLDKATQYVALAVERAGLPPPCSIDVLPSVGLSGSQKPNRFPRFPTKVDRPARVLVHARIVFDTKIQGPLILGAGRFFGLGLCRPVEDASPYLELDKATR